MLSRMKKRGNIEARPDRRLSAAELIKRLRLFDDKDTAKAVRVCNDIVNQLGLKVAA
jgi:hypothetical protein